MILNLTTNDNKFITNIKFGARSIFIKAINKNNIWHISLDDGIYEINILDVLKHFLNAMEKFISYYKPQKFEITTKYKDETLKKHLKFKNYSWVSSLISKDKYIYVYLKLN